MKHVDLVLTILLAAQSLGGMDPHPTVPEGVGVNIHFTDPRPGELKMLAASGVRWVRMDFAWNATETTKGQYNFAAYDRLVALLEPYKIRAIFILDYTNKFYDNGLSPYTNEGVNAFAGWASAAASHFKGRGILWEMYNEPNTSWTPKPDWAAYVRLALAVGEAIRQAVPGEEYIGPAIWADLPLLEACFKPGLLNYWSAVSVHPYRSTDPETAASADFQTLRLLIRRYVPQGRQIPILSGEWGYSSVEGVKGVSEDKQGKFLARQWLNNLANDVPISIWYDWHDDGLDSKDPEHHFGLVRYPYDGTRSPVYSPKPAYYAAQTLTTLLDGYRFNKRLRVGGSNDYALMFTRGDAVRVVVWTTAPVPHALAVPASPGRFLVTAHTGEKLPAITATQDGLSVLATDAPQYLEAEKPDPLWRVAAAWERAPLEIFAPAPTATLTLHLRNPLTAPIRVRVNGEALPQMPPGMELLVTTRLKVMRQTEPGRTTIECEVAGLGRIAQETQVIANNPLLVSMSPVAGNALPVGVANPSGEAYRGNVALTELRGLRCRTCRAPLEFKAGETEKTVRVPIDSTQAVYQVGAEVLDEKGETVLNVPARQFAQIDDLSRYASGSPSLAYQLVPEGDPKVASQQTLTFAAPPEGPPFQGMGCLKIAYHFAVGWKFIRLAPAAGTIPGQPHGFGLWLYPDGGPNVVRLRIVDQTGQTFQAGNLLLTWKGWRYTLFPMDAANASHWGGANDGVMHYPIRWDCLLLIDSASRAETQGVLYVSAPALIY